MCTRSVNIAFAAGGADILMRVAQEDGIGVVTDGLAGDILWAQRREDALEYMQLARTEQLLNRIPGMHTACSKLATHQALSEGCPLPFWPRSWAYTGAQPELLSERIFASLPEGSAVIVKPSQASQGVGISLARGKDELCRSLLRIRQTLRESATGERDLRRVTDEAIIQHYIDPPLLLDGLKFDFRVYVLVCPAEEEHQSLDELGPAFLCKEGLARFCTKAYSPPVETNTSWANMHLTNTSVSKSSDAFEVTEDPSNGRRGSKRKLSAVLQCLAQDGLLSLDEFWKSLEVITTTLLRRLGGVVYANAVSKQAYSTPPIPGLDCEKCARIAPSRFGQAFNLLGLDVMLSSKGEVLLLEANSSPSLAIEDLVPLQPAGRRVDGQSRSVRRASHKRWAAVHDLCSNSYLPSPGARLWC
eukprot:TRINITY_DN28295_c0_g1_i2.p1 TRINITY_DN28295_c0_g1~~TRINITY_DN28295_c0_g1_i2.p1  ORF type:complete len:416 (+),score=71.36 TRINITY_DN28295_c0_g1_i2:24-1271(+)